MTFYVGQKVVCIAHRSRSLCDLGLPSFKKGAVYTISGFYDEPPYGLFITVAELDQRVGGHYKGFRPVVERKTDIGFAHEILRKAKAPARALALTSTPRGDAT